MVEKAKGVIDIEAKGLQNLSEMAQLVTGINQGLELTAKIMGVVTRATREFIATGSQFEQYNLQFQTLTGSAENATKRVKELFDFASSTPFELAGVIEAGKTLDAYRITAEGALGAVGDAAAAMGKDFNETALALAGAATGEMERLKQFGITSFQITQELGHEMVRNTQEGLDEIAQAVVDLFDKQFGGGMARLRTSMGGIINELKDSWTKFTKMVADSLVFDTAKTILGDMLKIVNELFDQGKAEQAAALIGKALSDALWVGAIAMADAADSLMAIAGPLVKARKVAAAATTVGLDPGLALQKLVAAAQGYDPKQLGPQAIEGFGINVLPTTPFGALAGFGAGLGGGEGAGTYGERARALRDAQEFAQAAAGFYVPPGPVAGGFGPAGPGGVPARPAEIGGPSIPSGPFGFNPFGGGQGLGQLYGGDTEVRGFGGMPDLEKTEEVLDGFTDLQIEAADQTVEAWFKARDIMQTGWDTFYTQTATMGANWVKTGKLQWKELGNAAKAGVAAVADAFLSEKKKEWAIQAAGAAVDAIMAFPNMAVVGSKLAAAAGYTALVAGAGIASGAINQSLGGGVAAASDVSPSVGSAPGVESASDQPGTRSISRTVGVRAQTLNIHNTIVHNSAAVYGVGGLAQMFEDELVPMIQDAFDSGALNAG